MLTDSTLTETVRRCPCSIPKNNLTASFTEYKKLSFRWTNNNERLHIYFADYLRVAPPRVIMDLTKKIIQNALYNSDNELSKDTKEWLFLGLHTPENVRSFIERNGLVEIRQYNDAVIVTSDGLVVDSAPLFRVISIPKDMAESPEIDSIIPTLYDRMMADGEQFLEV